MSAVNAGAPPAPVERRRLERILFVDDEEALLFLAERLLGRLGYRVTTFDSPIEALQAFRESPEAFDALVTDISMPAMNGFDLAAEIRALRPSLPVVVISGYLRPEDEERAASLGVRALIPKANVVEEMAASLDRIFQQTAT